MSQEKYPKQHVLRKLFYYDEFDGCLRWAGNRDSQGIEKGDRAATPGQDGYMHVNCFGKKYKEHVLIWKFLFNEESPPGEEIDHKDQDRHNNHKANLRRSTKQENLSNRKKWGNNPLKGVFKSNKRWKALIRLDEAR